MRNTVSSNRKGFTLIEVILAIVVVAVIMGIAIPKVMSNSDKAQIKQIISSDVRSIIAAAADWKRTDRSSANGVYTALSAELLSSRLPSNMDATGTLNTARISSSGFNGGCVFATAVGASSGIFSMAMDCTTAATNLNWDNKLKAYATEAFFDTVRSLSSNAAKDTTNNNLDGIDCSAENPNVICVKTITQ